MPGINKTDRNQVVVGADLTSFVEVQLLGAEADEIFGVDVAHVDGFYRCFEVSMEDAKKLSRDRGAKRVYREGGVLLKQLTTKDTAMLELTSLYGGVETRKLFEKLEGKLRNYRGTRPAPDDRAEAGETILYGIRNACVQAGFQDERGQNEVKSTRTIEGSGTDAGLPSFEEEYVDLTDETGWPANLADFRSDTPVKA
jgi:hypothetical protein